MPWKIVDTFSYLDSVSSQISLKLPLQCNFADVQGAPSLISQFSGLVSLFDEVVIENEFTTAHSFEKIIKQFNLVHFMHGFTKAHCIVYQKCKGMQAYARAERRSVTDTQNITPE